MSDTIAENNRGGIALVSDHVRFTMQTEANGAGSIIDTGTGTNVLGATVALGGTTTDILDPATGVLTFHASGNPYVVNTTDTAVANWFSMAQNSAGGYLVLFQYTTTLTVPTATEYLFSAGHHTTANGGFYCRIGTDGKLVCHMESLTGTGINVLGVTNICDDSPHTVAMYYDCANNATYLYVDGSDDISGGGPGAWGFSNLPTITSDRNVGLFCRATSATASDDLFGASAAGPLLANLWIVRAETDISASIPAIATEFNNNPSKMLWALDGL